MIFEKLFFQPSCALRIYEFIYSEGPLPTKNPNVTLHIWVVLLISANCTPSEKLYVHFAEGKLRGLICDNQAVSGLLTKHHLQEFGPFQIMVKEDQQIFISS